MQQVVHCRLLGTTGSTECYCSHIIAWETFGKIEKERFVFQGVLRDAQAGSAADSAGGRRPRKGPLDAEVKALQDEVARVVCANSGQLKLLQAELLAMEEERAAEAALHDRELAQLERQLAVSVLEIKRPSIICLAEE
jgi:hypothetical protein